MLVGHKEFMEHPERVVNWITAVLVKWLHCLDKRTCPGCPDGVEPLAESWFAYAVKAFTVISDHELSGPASWRRVREHHDRVVKRGPQLIECLANAHCKNRGQ